MTKYLLQCNELNYTETQTMNIIHYELVWYEDETKQITRQRINEYQTKEE